MDVAAHLVREEKGGLFQTVGHELYRAIRLVFREDASQLDKPCYTTGVVVGSRIGSGGVVMRTDYDASSLHRTQTRADIAIRTSGRRERLLIEAGTRFIEP